MTEEIAKKDQNICSHCKRHNQITLVAKVKSKSKDCMVDCDTKRLCIPCLLKTLKSFFDYDIPIIKE